MNTEPESPPNRTQEAYEQKRKKKAANRKSRQASARKAAKKPTARATASSGGKFERGGEYKPGIRYRKTMDRKTKSELLRTRGQYHVTDTQAAKADTIQGSKHMFRDAEA